MDDISTNINFALRYISTNDFCFLIRLKISIIIQTLGGYMIRTFNKEFTFV